MRRRSDAEDHSVARDIALVVAGIGIGTGVALLLAPNSGEELRHEIGRRYRRTVKHLGRRTEDLRDRVEDLLESAGIPGFDDCTQQSEGRNRDNDADHRQHRAQFVAQGVLEDETKEEHSRSVCLGARHLKLSARRSACVPKPPDGMELARPWLKPAAEPARRRFRH